MAETPDYKATINLPRTEFPMRAKLPQREPEVLQAWQAQDLYARLREVRAGLPKYVLHDGPPYANGRVHLGTALNKILKDFVIKSASMMGHDAPYVPGWDCHGMPIEHQVVKELGDRFADFSVLEIRKRCRDFALENVEVMKASFQRLGVFGDWTRPYLTLSRAYERTIIRAFKELVANGYIYKGQRSIVWCATCATPLAGAEVEYDEHTSPSITVRFRVREGDPRAGELDLPPETAVVIWTTTPWTIPANVAIALHPDFTYVLLKTGRGHQIVARELRESFLEETGLQEHEEVRTFSGKELAGLRCVHPLYEDRDSLVVLADHVTLEQGTGCVHTAPGHGEEDFELGMREGLPILCPVDGHGTFTEEAPPYTGTAVFAANPRVVEDLRAAGALLATSEVRHSYPHCWRCKQPLIFRATNQWFLKVDHRDLRKQALATLPRVTWYPRWGIERMRNMIEVRPDWCLSRQRAWGVPIPAFTCGGCGEVVLDEKVIEGVEQAVAEHGSDVWFQREAAELLPAGFACPHCGSDRIEKDQNILDVWFDSSVSYLQLAQADPEDNPWPCDLYLEAVDQHRGWFQVSLVTCLGTRGSAPYQGVMTHGLILDEQGRKMSKSLGNVLTPEEIIDQYGCDILRLFFCSVDFAGDVRFSRALLEPITEAYRKIRNTFRFLLGNLHDFDPGRDAVPADRMEGLDRFALQRLEAVKAQAERCFRAMEFHRFYTLIINYCINDLSALYLDILKDRLYIEAADSPARRSAQTALFEIAHTLCRLLAPILAFTAEEIWTHLPAFAGRESSVHLARFAPAREEWADAAALADWEAIWSVRERVSKALEEAREQKRIGNSLEARVTLAVSGAPRAVLDRFAARLPALFIVSGVELTDGGETVAVTVDRARGDKCRRCWNYRESVGRSPDHPACCDRCVAVLAATG